MKGEEICAVLTNFVNNKRAIPVAAAIAAGQKNTISNKWNEHEFVLFDATLRKARASCSHRMENENILSYSVADGIADSQWSGTIQITNRHRTVWCDDFASWEHGECFVWLTSRVSAASKRTSSGRYYTRCHLCGSIRSIALNSFRTSVHLVWLFSYFHFIHCGWVELHPKVNRMSWIFLRSFHTIHFIQCISIAEQNSQVAMCVLKQFFSSSCRPP